MPDIERMFYSEPVANVPGIYRIVCTANDRFYIGSAVNLRKRRKDHFGSLEKGTHRNGKLQNSWNKYGAESFTFEVLEFVQDKAALTEREQAWIDEFNPFFNIALIAGSSLGQKRSLESRQRMSAWQIGRPSPRKGQKQPPEAIEKQRKSLTGYKHTEETRRKMANIRRGRTHTEETREKMRRSALGHTPTNAKTFILTSPDGVEYVVHGLPKFCQEHGINTSTIIQVAKGKRKQHKGWTARYPESDAI